MANDRLYLVHPGIRLAVLLAKSWDVGWVGWVNEDRIALFFDLIRKARSEDCPLALMRESEIVPFPSALKIIGYDFKSNTPEAHEWVRSRIEAMDGPGPD